MSLLTVEVVSNTACQTEYKVTDPEGRVFDVVLWIIVGGTPALALGDYTCTRRFETQSLWCCTNWCTNAPDLYAHQSRKPNGEVIGSPTIENALPRGMADLVDWLEWAKVEHKQLMLVKAKLARIQAVEQATGRMRRTWPERVPEDRPRLLNCATYGHNTWRTTGAWLKHALAGAEGGNIGTVKIGCMIVGVTGLRKLANELRKDTIDITITPASDGERPSMTITSVLCVSNPTRMHRSRLVYGAFDRYRGEGGYTCEIILSKQLTLPLDDRRYRPGKYNPVTLARK